MSAAAITCRFNNFLLLYLEEIRFSTLWCIGVTLFIWGSRAGSGQGGPSVGTLRDRVPRRTTEEVDADRRSANIV